MFSRITFRDLAYFHQRENWRKLVVAVVAESRNLRDQQLLEEFFFPGYFEDVLKKNSQPEVQRLLDETFLVQGNSSSPETRLNGPVTDAECGKYTVIFYI